MSVFKYIVMKGGNASFKAHPYLNSKYFVFKRLVGVKSCPKPPKNKNLANFHFITDCIKEVVAIPY